MDSYEPNSARDLINRFIATVGARDEHGVVPFVQAWPRIVGQDKAAHSQVLDVRNGTVLIGVDHPAWLQRLHMDRVRTIARIRRDFPSLGAQTLAFTIVSDLSRSWSGEEPAGSGAPEPDADPSAPAHGGRAPDPAAGKAAATDADAHGHAASAEPDPQSGVEPPRAAEDQEFQKRLASLREALERRDSDDSAGSPPDRGGGKLN